MNQPKLLSSLASTPQFKLQNNLGHLHLRVNPRKQVQRLLIGQKMPTHFQLFLYHLHHINHTIFLFYVHHHPFLFHLFNITLNVLVIILVSLVVILILILILFIHLTIFHSNHILIPKHILTSTGNLTPDFLISAALSRLWDGSVPLDTIFFVIFSVLSVLLCFLCLHF